MARKSRGRLSDAAPVAAMSPGNEDGPSHVSVDVRKIDNGYVSTHTVMDAGEYRTREEYHAKRPRVEEVLGVGDRTGSGMDEGPNHLRAAVGMMKKGTV
jgi:hypothetical protein